MDWIGVIGLCFSGGVIFFGLLWWVFKQGRDIGVSETVLKHEDKSLNARVQKIERDIEEINGKLSGTEFWDQMRTLIKEVKGETNRHERSAD